jgi:predicted phosphodiesterase
LQFVDELARMTRGTRGVTAAKIMEAIARGEAPALAAEVCRIRNIGDDEISPKHVGEALSDLRRDGAPIVGYLGHASTTVWSAVSNPAVRPAVAVGHPVSAGDADCVGEIARLIKLTQKRTVQFSDLCDALDMPPSRVRHLVDDAQSKGYHVNVAGNAIGWKEPEPNLDAAQDVGVAPTVGGRQIIAVISDTHFGSSYCLREQLREFIEYAYSRGARHVLHAGDILDGCYDHGRWELSHHGLDKQIDDAIETLPRLDGLRYVAISGNHDETFTKSTGMDTGRAIVDRFRSEGRTDLEYVGPRGAMLRLGGVRIELWHPRQTSAAYSLSYRLQNKIRDTSVGRKPDLLLAGHWHTSVYLEQRGVHALACGTFQGGGSAFSKSLGGAPSIGGTLISWETTEHGTLRRVAVERSAYYENEAPREIA